MRAESGNLAIAKALLARGSHLDVQDGDGCTPLYIALDEDELEVADFLLEQGADPDIGNKDIGDKNTLLAWASSRRVLDHVELLIVGPIQMSAENLACFPTHGRGRGQIIEALLEAGADPCLREPSGLLPRQIAEKNARSVKAGCVAVLLEAETKKGSGSVD